MTLSSLSLLTYLPCCVDATLGCFGIKGLPPQQRPSQPASSQNACRAFLRPSKNGGWDMLLSHSLSFSFNLPVCERRVCSICTWLFRVLFRLCSGSPTPLVRPLDLLSPPSSSRCGVVYKPRKIPPPTTTTTQNHHHHDPPQSQCQ